MGCGSKMTPLVGKTQDRRGRKVQDEDVANKIVAFDAESLLVNLSLATEIAMYSVQRPAWSTREAVFKKMDARLSRLKNLPRMLLCFYDGSRNIAKQKGIEGIKRQQTQEKAVKKLQDAYAAPAPTVDETHEEAHDRLNALKKLQAQVSVVSPDICAAVKQWIEH